MREERDMGVRRGVGIPRLGLLALVGALVAILLVPSIASAATLTDEDELAKFGSSGTGAGQFDPAGDSAADPVTGHLYVLDSGNNRIDEFTPWGEFVKAFGWDVAPAAVNEQQEVRVRAGAGTFKLTFGASTTPDLPYNASAEAVKSALNALSTIGGAGGSVAVEGALGNPETDTPFVYVVAFKGSLAGKDVSQLEAANGSTPLSGGKPKTELEVRTRADGTPGGTGLESCTEESGCRKGSEGPVAISSPGSIAVDPAGGIYVSEWVGDELNRRVQKLSPSGHFLWMIGGDTITDGAAGTGILTPGSATVKSVVTIEKAFRVGQAIEGTGIEPGTTIAAVGFPETLGGPGTITLSAPAGPAATGTTTGLSVKAGTNNVPSNDKDTIALGANTTGGVFRLGYSTPKPSLNEAITGASTSIRDSEAGSPSATATTASGSPALDAVAAPIASGKLTSGSKTLEAFKDHAKSPFPPGPANNVSAGEGIAGPGIPAGTTVVATSGPSLTLSANATTTSSNVPLSLTAKGTATTATGSNQLTAVITATGSGTLASGSKNITGLATASGEFRRGQTISGTGIPAGTTIVAQGTETLELSAPATASGAQSLSAGTQPFALGQTISGTGIPAGTTVVAIEGQTLTLSANATASASGVAISATQRPFVSKGMTVEGPGIPSGTTVESVAANGDVTLSANATASAAGVPLQIGIAYNATAATLQTILEAMPNIGAGNVAVTGLAGGPWTVEFKGARYADTAVEPLNGGAYAVPSVHTVLLSGLQVSSGAREIRVTSAKGGEVCRAIAECQAADEGGAQGEFGGTFEKPSQGLSVATVPGNGIAVASGNRIQRFDAEGEFQSQIEPAALKEVEVGALAVDPIAGKLYVAGGDKVQELDPVSGNELGSLKAAPGALATDPTGDLFAAVHQVAPGDEEFVSNEVGPFARVIEFDSAGKRASVFGESELIPSPKESANNRFFLQGLGAGALGDVYVAYGGSETTGQNNFIRSFGPPPISLESPPLRPPEIAAQYARSVASDEAELRARINPHFWNDTTYHVEYGTAPCAEGGCADTAPVRLSSKPAGFLLTSQGVLLEGLEPGTVYHYRFVAESSGGGPVYGPDATFTTFRASGAAECPENEAFRSGSSALLPDCRAYEMVSPVDKEGGDIMALGAPPNLLPGVRYQAAVAGDKLAYGSYRSFGDAQEGAINSQYVATRRKGAGWATHTVSPPRGKAIFGVVEQLQAEFQLFSPDLCGGWVQSVAEPPLAPEAPAGSIDLYRRTDEECGGPSYVPLNTTAAGSGLNLELQGVSEDEETTVFLANRVLAAGGTMTEGGASDRFQLYGSQGGKEKFLCILPAGGAFGGSCTAGAAYSGGGFNAQDNQVTNALSADGQRLYWTASGATANGGPIYLRTNPLAPQSALAHGSATGTGKLSEGSTAVTALIAAKGKASIVEKSTVATLTEAPSAGEFVAGQPLNVVAGIEAGTKIVSCSPQCGPSAKTLTLSKAATQTKESVTLTSKGPMPFAVGQTIVAPGIPVGATITAVKEGELTLSKAASANQSGVAMEAYSECTEAEAACTLPVSAAAEAQAGTSGARFWAASEDGAKAIFTTGGSGASNSNLYEYRLADRSTHLIAGKVQGLMGASADASRIYLASKEALGGPNGEGHSAVAGNTNLYFYEAGEPPSYSFIGALAANESPSPIAGPSVERASRVSLDGESAAFSSIAPLTGYDNTDSHSGKADAEIFVYDARAGEGQGRLVCASCNPSGSRPVGQEFHLGGNSGPWTAGHIPVPENVLYASRVLSDSGHRLFFDSFDALSPRDTNGKQDVYEWEAPGSGTCEESSPTYSPENQGCVDLISLGTSTLDSEFLDASPSGEDVFFATLSSLVSSDPGLVDVYDARVSGGLPEPPPPAAQCEGEACQGNPEAPNDPTPSSESFEGAGNVHEEPVVQRPKPCAKGKVRRHGKCVAKHTKKAHRRAKRNRRAGR